MSSGAVRPSPYDRVLATRFGVAAVQLVRDGEFGTMVALEGNRITQRPAHDRSLRRKNGGYGIYELAKMVIGGRRS